MKRRSLAATTAALGLAAAIGSGTAFGQAGFTAAVQEWYSDAFGKKADELRWGAERQAAESFREAADLLAQQAAPTYGKQVEEAAEQARQRAFDTYSEHLERYLRELDEAEAELAGPNGAIDRRFEEAAAAAQARADDELERSLDELLTELTQGD
ncbi:hypothetical protein HGI30_22375 [Paenibacillus albicereus]|uniref:YtxH domain-containing protein n=1 Tax=Paenibacillus albicereus TaxID=2726185 RepID=A0A6H2H3T1_9BACL|nr:hypothetical protein [Paenibacillus albicereus]QJC53998.1 hypothetical protein HGI30_22375 [Paenibacillus albicereus]